MKVVDQVIIEDISPRYRTSAGSAFHSSSLLLRFGRHPVQRRLMAVLRRQPLLVSWSRWPTIPGSLGPYFSALDEAVAKYILGEVNGSSLTGLGGSRGRERWF